MVCRFLSLIVSSDQNVTVLILLGIFKKNQNERGSRIVIIPTFNYYSTFIPTTTVPICLYLYTYWYNRATIIMYGHTYSKSMDQPGKVASPARGQLNRKK